MNLEVPQALAQRLVGWVEAELAAGRDRLVAEGFRAGWDAAMEAARAALGMVRAVPQDQRPPGGAPPPVDAQGGGATASDPAAPAPADAARAASSPGKIGGDGAGPVAAGAGVPQPDGEPKRGAWRTVARAALVRRLWAEGERRPGVLRRRAGLIDTHLPIPAGEGPWYRWLDDLRLTGRRADESTDDALRAQADDSPQLRRARELRAMGFSEAEIASAVSLPPAEVVCVAGGAA